MKIAIVGTGYVIRVKLDKREAYAGADYADEARHECYVMPITEPASGSC